MISPCGASYKGKSVVKLDIMASKSGSINMPQCKEEVIGCVQSSESKKLHSKCLLTQLYNFYYDCTFMFGPVIHNSHASIRVSLRTPFYDVVQ